MRLRYGVAPELEEMADALIFAETATTMSHEDKRDVLTPWKIKDRANHEVLTPVAERHQRAGTYTRAYNPRQTWMNSREGLAQFGAKLTPQHVWMVEVGIDPTRFDVGVALTKKPVR